MMGPVYGIESYTAGAMYSNSMLVWILIVVALMNIMLVVRHTRADEESGRAEVVRSLPTGRLSNLNATMIVVLIINLVNGLLTGLLIAATGVETMGFAGSMLYGAVLCVFGLFFAAVAAVFSQISTSSRGAIGLSLVTLGVLYLMRAAGDLNSEALSLISPMGLIQRAQIYVENYWWPVGAVLLITVLVAVLAYKLNSIRDIGLGFIHARPGRKNASPLLRSSFGLSFRLLRNIILAWTVGIFILGASYASVLGDFDSFVASSEFYSMIIGSSPGFTIAQMFVSMVVSLATLFAVVPVLIVALKVRGEEKDERSEHVLTRSVSRVKYLLGYVILAVITSILVQGADALGIYSAAQAVLADPSDLTLGYLIKAHFVFLPALWVMIGITVLLIGLIPKATAAIWAYFGFTFFAVFMGRIPDLLPGWFSKLTPFGFIPQLPMDEINYGTLAVLTLIAAALTVAGLFFYRRRDMVT
jgi:ABC-2 type transport system permease protein